MFKILIFFITILSCLSCSTKEKIIDTSPTRSSWMTNYSEKGILPAASIEFFKQQLGWSNEELLYVFYNYDSRICGFAPKRLAKPEDRVEDALEMEKTYFDYIPQKSKRIVHVDYIKDLGKAAALINDRFYWDKDNILAQNFFRKKDDCIAVFVLNQKGEYYQQTWHISKEQVYNYSKWLTNESVEKK